MQKEKTSIEVPEAIAQAYRNASPEKRQRAERAMAAALMSRKEVAAEFRKITERASEYAARQGLTSEKLDELVHEDNDK